MTPRALKKWRLRLDISQDAFARWLGVSRTTVNRWECGRQTIPKMLGLLEREHTANEPDPTDTDCGCIQGVQACDYHAAGMGGRWRAWEDAQKAPVEAIVSWALATHWEAVGDHLDLSDEELRALKEEAE